MSAAIKSEKKLVENYISQHNLETSINEVVNQCVRERPRDPFDFLAKTIAEKSTFTKGILDVVSYQVFDARGNPTLEVQVHTNRGVFVSQVPSSLSDYFDAEDPIEEEEEGSEEKEGKDDPAGGGSEGKDGAVEEEHLGEDDDSQRGGGEYVQLRDEDPRRYCGRSVEKLVEYIHNAVAPKLQGLDAVNQEELDNILAEVDGTATRSVLGANTCLATSMAICRAGANVKGVPLYRHIASLADNSQFVIPVPCIALISGGDATHIKETMAFEKLSLLPIGADNFAEAMKIGLAVQKSLFNAISESAPNRIPVEHADGSFVVDHIRDVQQVIDLVLRAVNNTPYAEKAKLGLTVNGAKMYNEAKQAYDLAFKTKSSHDFKNAEDLLQMYRDLIETYPSIISFVDPFGNEDASTYKLLTEEFGEALQIAGDHCIRANGEKLAEAMVEETCNTVVIKLTYMSSVSEAIRLVKVAQDEGFGVILATDECETGDDFLCHLAVGLQVGLIVTGAPRRGENVAKLNSLLRIESELGEEAFYAADRFRLPV